VAALKSDPLTRDIPVVLLTTDQTSPIMHGDMAQPPTQQAHHWRSTSGRCVALGPRIDPSRFAAPIFAGAIRGIDGRRLQNDLAYGSHRYALLHSHMRASSRRLGGSIKKPNLSNSPPPEERARYAAVSPTVKFLRMCNIVPVASLCHDRGFGLYGYAPAPSRY